MAVLSVIVILLVSITNQTTKVWQDSSGRIEAFRSSRAAFESVTQTLSQATLNTYYDYFDAGGVRISPDTVAPSKYDRFSELHFISGPASTLLNGVQRADGKAYPAVTSGHAVFFQAPLGFTLDGQARELDNMLNSTGYFTEFGSDQDLIPDFIATKVKARHRYRLVQFIQPAEENAIYTEKWAIRSTGAGASWFKGPLGATDRPVRILAENVVAVLIQPKRSDKEASANASLSPLAPNYSYDSQPRPSGGSVNRYQLPPLVDVTLVAIDEPSAVRLALKNGQNPPLAGTLQNLFTTTADTNDLEAFRTDMDTLAEALAAAKLNFRVFSSEVGIRASKWNED